MTDFSGAADNSSYFDFKTLLLEVEDRKYVYISCLEITEFETNDKVIDCISLMGNNMVPYPIILGKKYTYFLYDRMDRKTMEYCCEVCPKKIKAKNKYKHFKSKSHQELDKCKHLLLSYKDIDIDHVDETFFLYIIEHDKKIDYFIKKWEFKLLFDDYQYCPYVTSNVADNKTMISWKIFLMNVIDDFEDKGYNFSHIAEMHIKTIANKRDMSYDFYIKHNMCALEWNIHAMNNENKSLINKIPCDWRHPLIRKFRNIHV